MLKEKEQVIRRVTMAIDLLVVVAAFFAAYFGRVYFRSFYKLDLFPAQRVLGTPLGMEYYMPMVFIVAPLWVMMLYLNGLYRPFRTRHFIEIVLNLFNAAFFTTISFGGIAFIFKIHFISRLFFAMFIATGLFFLILEKWAIVSIAHYVRKKGYNFRRLLIVGTGQRAIRFVKMFKEHPEWGFHIFGLIDDEKPNVGKVIMGIEVKGVLDDIPRILSENVIDEVIFVVPRKWLERIQKSIAACEIQGVKTHVAADLFDLRIAKAQQTDLNGVPLLSFETTVAREWQLFVKRLVDFTISLAVLLLCLPLLLITAAIVKLTSRGHVFFKQKRVGLNGRIFTVYKFRSMYEDAEQKRTDLEYLNEMDGPVFKITNDPRITPIGRFLRRMSIDELPQMFNVLIGNMSLVGPRPAIPQEVEKYELWQRRRLSLRPGITCIWQVSGRNKIGFDKWMELDLEYIDNWSLWLDVKLLMKTIPVVLFRIGAK